MTSVEPTGIGTQNLGSMFGTRTAGAGKLPPRPHPRHQENAVDVPERPAEPEKPAQKAAAPSAAQERTETPPKPARRVTNAAKVGKTDRAAGEKRQIIVYLPI